MSPRVIRVEQLNRWLSLVRQLADYYRIRIDLADIGWVGRYQRGLSPAQALEEHQPSLRQLDLFITPHPR